MTLKFILEETARRHGEKTALIMGDFKLSYRALDDTVNRVANALIKMGVTRGDRVAIMLPNSPEFVVNYFAIVKLGAIAVLLDPYYKALELISIFNNAQPKVLVTESDTLDILVPAFTKIPPLEHIIEVGSRYKDRFHNYQQIITGGPAQPVNIKPSPEDIALIAYSSGPAFTPKGATMTQGDIFKETEIMTGELRMTERDIMMLYALPMHHMFGLGVGLVMPVYNGNTVVIVPGTGLSLSSFLDTIDREKGTIFLGVPYIYALTILTAENEGVHNDLSSLRLCISAGAPLPPDTVRQFKRYYGLDILDFYGLTESTCLVTGIPLDGSGKPGSVGKAFRGWEIKIVDAHGRKLPTNQSGEIIARGPIMRGYYNNPQATAATIKDGWLFTGDIGRVDKDGWLFITGRKKAAIIVKGQNIYPADIEQILLTYPGLAGVAVISIPDKMRGEVIGAVIKMKTGKTTTEQDIKQFCLERLASYKVPKQVIFVDSLPETSNNGIDREALRKSLAIPPVF